MPRRVLEHHVEKQKWTASDLFNSSLIYQLSLRVGTSYQATCWALQQQGVLNVQQAKQLADTEVKSIKKKLMGVHRPKSWRGNVWALTEKDEGSLIRGEPEDVFIVRLREQSGAGYLWDLEQVQSAGFDIVSDERVGSAPVSEIGGAVDRIVTAISEVPAMGNFEFLQCRPWDKSDIISNFSMGYDLRGKEQGRPRAARENLPAA